MHTKAEINDQIIAIAATIFKCKPVRFFVGDKSSLILSFTFSLKFDSL